MTSATSSSKYSPFRMFFSGNLFINNTKRSWPVTLLLFLLIFFSCPVVMLLTLNYSSKDASFGTIVNDMLSEPLTALMYVYAVLFALISVGLVMGYMHSKRSSYFYGSLPIKRGALFAAQYATGVIFFLVPFIANILLTLGVIAIFGAMSTLSATVMWSFILETITIYMVTYAFAVLASNLSGMKSTSLMVMLVLFFYLPALYFSILGYVGVLYRYIDVDYLMSSMHIIKLSPIVNTFYILQDSTTISGVITLLLYILVPSLIALWLNHKLSFEASENAITFRSFQSTLKYAVIIPCAIAGALLFYALGELNGYYSLYSEMTPSGVAWLTFGAISGGLLSYMIINVILNKNFKALFDKFRNFGIFAAIFAVLFTLFAADLPGLDKYVPSESSVTSVKLNNYYQERSINYSSSFTDNDSDRAITDKELISQINRIAKIMIEYGESGDWKEDDTEIWSSEMFYFRPVYKLGLITLPKKMSIPTSLIEDEIENLNENPEYAKYTYYPLLEDNLEEIMRDNVSQGTYTLNLDNLASVIYKYAGEYQPNTSYDLTLDEVISLMNIIGSDLKAGCALEASSDSIMQIYVNGYKSRSNFYFNISITDTFKNTVSYLTEKGITSDKDFSNAAEIIDSLTLTTSDSKAIITDKEEIISILENLVSYSDEENAVSINAQMNDDAYDSEIGDIFIGYIDYDKLPDTIRDRLSGI